MSRRAPGGPAAISSTPNASDDVCPVCKSNRYLNKDLKFLIDPECYHKMCSTCVDRLFTAGPAPCPIVGCHRTLRKKNFKPPYFGNLAIERETDIRGRVLSVYNMKEKDFGTLRIYNDYLEEIEDLVFDLSAGNEKERAAAEKKLKAYSQGHKGEIAENKRKEEAMRQAEKAREKKELADARERRVNAALLEEQEKLDVEQSKREVLDALANTDGDADAIMQDAQRVILKKSNKRRKNLEEGKTKVESEDVRNPHMRGTGPSVVPYWSDFRARQAPVVEAPYDPFGGVILESAMFVLQDDYENEWLNEAKNNQAHTAGGYSLQEYYARTMFEAFSGAGVFIENKTDQAEEAMKMELDVPMKMELDDPF